MKKLFIPLIALTLIVAAQTSGTLTGARALMYSSATNDTVRITLKNMKPTTVVIHRGATPFKPCNSCDFQDSLILGGDSVHVNTRVIYLRTRTQNIYGSASPFAVTYTVTPL